MDFSFALARLSALELRKARTVLLDVWLFVCDIDRNEKDVFRSVILSNAD